MIKLELLWKPNILHLGIGKSINKELISVYDATKRDIGSAINVLGVKFNGLERHLYYGFYFRLPPDLLIEIMSQTDLRITRDIANDNEDEGILSGCIEDFWDGMHCFCRKDQPFQLRLLFNMIDQGFEQDGIHCPFKKHDLGDRTLEYAYLPR